MKLALFPIINACVFEDIVVFHWAVILQPTLEYAVQSLAPSQAVSRETRESLAHVCMHSQGFTEIVKFKAVVDVCFLFPMKQR